MSLNKDASIQPHPSQSEEQAETRKRKRDETERDAIELDSRPFTIRPDESDPFAAPRVFTPLCLLLRARLPLAYLDTSSDSNRCFSADIRSLEALEEAGETPSVLIAECEKERKLYAIEWAQKRTYALCRLGQGVKKEDLQRSARAVVQREEVQVKRQAVQAVSDAKPWWSRAAVEMPSDLDASVESMDAPKLAMKAAVPLAINEATVSDLPPGTQAVPEIAGDEPTGESQLVEPAIASDVLQELAKQYQDALYFSRTPLAFFTKGPLSRARAAFTGPGSALDSVELIGFLRDSILTASVGDKKYKDAVSGIVKELPPIGLETPEQTSKSKRKRKWKSKRDKYGLFSDEKDFVAKWWRSHDDLPVGMPPSAETLDTALRRRIPRTRSRETYLQVILVLEVLALEATVPWQPALDATLAAESQDQTQQDQSQVPKDSKKSKPKKPQDLPALLEILLDRLCIWHSLDFHSPAKKIGDKDSDSNDELKSFCIEVVVPFYISRCPQHAAIVNKKLGGPSAPTPIKRKAASSLKPGKPATRQAPEQKARKPLSRTATETLNPASKLPPSLHRSSTDSQLLQQQIKRESSESPSLGSVPPSGIRPPQPRKRNPLMHSASFNRAPREVDFSAMSQANQARMRKKADIEQRLQDAKASIVKPNRALALKEVAESADLSFAKATAKSRSTALKAKASTHVTATPKHVKTTPAARARPTNAGPTSSTDPSRVPSSSARLFGPPQPQAGDELPAPSSLLVPQTGHRPRYNATSSRNVEDTPSRGFAKYMPHNLVHAPGTLESPIAARRVQVEQTPVKPVRSLSLVPPAVGALVEASPNAVRRTLEPLPPAANDSRGRSVYAALGWDDD